MVLGGVKSTGFENTNGGALGLPMFHAVTGNLPVASEELHHPDKDFNGKPLTSGHLRDLPPGWVKLLDMSTGKDFYWNTFFRSRREVFPAEDDDGSFGAGKGEANASAKARRNALLTALNEAKTWTELYDRANSRTYFWNRKTKKTQWARPANFYEDGVSYKSRWVEVLSKSGVSKYKDRSTGHIHFDMPEDFDGTPSMLCWEKDQSLNWVNWVTGEVSETRPESLDSEVAKEPYDDPPGPPSEALAAEHALADIDDENVLDDKAAFEEHQKQLMFPTMKGYLMKKGGGFTFMGGKTWKKRFFVSMHGVLNYYANETIGEAATKEGKGKPVKKIIINLRCYKVDDCKGDPTRFNLAPNSDAFLTYVNQHGVGVPLPDRVFEFEASTPQEKDNWVSALKGRRRIDDLAMKKAAESRISMTGRVSKGVPSDLSAVPPPPPPQPQSTSSESTSSTETEDGLAEQKESPVVVKPAVVKAAAPKVVAPVVAPVAETKASKKKEEEKKTTTTKTTTATTSSSSTSSSAASIQNPSAPVLPPHWYEVKTEDGEVYYHNEVTDETSWDFPGGNSGSSSPVKFAQAAPVLNMTEEEVIDPNEPTVLEVADALTLLLSQAEEVEAEIDLYHDMDKNQLLEECEKRGVSAEGGKKELRRRLRAIDEGSPDGHPDRYDDMDREMLIEECNARQIRSTGIRKQLRKRLRIHDAARTFYEEAEKQGLLRNLSSIGYGKKGFKGSGSTRTLSENESRKYTNLGPPSSPPPSLPPPPPMPSSTTTTTSSSSSSSSSSAVSLPPPPPASGLTSLPPPPPSSSMSLPPPPLPSGLMLPPPPPSGVMLPPPPPPLLPPPSSSNTKKKDDDDDDDDEDDDE